MTHDIQCNRDEYYYLACPHTHESAQVREYRYLAAVACHAHLTRAGMSIFNPIAMTHEVNKWAVNNGGEISHSAWLAADYPFLVGAVGMFILQLPGWGESKGIQWEVGVMEKLGGSIVRIPPDEYIKHWPKELLNSSTGGGMMFTDNKFENKVEPYTVSETPE